MTNELYEGKVLVNELAGGIMRVLDKGATNVCARLKADGTDAYLWQSPSVSSSLCDKA